MLQIKRSPALSRPLVGERPSADSGREPADRDRPSSSAGHSTDPTKVVKKPLYRVEGHRQN